MTEKELSLEITRLLQLEEQLENELKKTKIALFAAKGSLLSLEKEGKKAEYNTLYTRMRKNTTINSDWCNGCEGSLEIDLHEKHYFQIVRVTTSQRYQEVRCGIGYCYATLSDALKIKNRIENIFYEKDEPKNNTRNFVPIIIGYELVKLYISNCESPENVQMYACFGGGYFNYLFSEKSPWNEYGFTKYLFAPKNQETKLATDFYKHLEALTGLHWSHLAWIAHPIHTWKSASEITDKNIQLYDHFPQNQFNYPLKEYCKACNEYFVKQHTICANCLECLTVSKINHTEEYGSVSMCGSYQSRYTCSKSKNSSLLF